jgi:hypothetical protein
MVTETDFLEMPDRERDYWIDRHIIGIECRHMDSVYDSKTMKSTCRSCEVVYERGGGFDLSVPNYRSWSGAGRIIEKMRERGWAWDLCDRLDTWRVTIVNFYGGKHETDHDDPWTAVALAAGRAIGVIK